MVKGISRQVIVVHSPDPKLFEQAIFILKDDALTQEGITDEALLKEAKRIVSNSGMRKSRLWYAGFLWAGGGALLTGAVWLMTVLF